MLDGLKLQRPLACIDFESTGPNPRYDRIVQIGLTVFKDGQATTMEGLVNPGIPIPKEATEVHHITDEMVAGRPFFKDVADGFLARLENHDIIGFGLRKFDLPLLRAELTRCGKSLELNGKNVIDVMTIFHKKEPRDLSAACAFYLGMQDVKDAHAAGADTMHTLQVLDAMLVFYRRERRALPGSSVGLAELCTEEGALDSEGKFVLRGGKVHVNVGKHRGRSVEDIYHSPDRDYLNWASQNWGSECKAILKSEATRLRGDATSSAEAK